MFLTEKKLRKKKIGMIGAVFLIMLLFVTTSTALAMDTEQITNVLRNNRDVFHVNTIVGSMFRWVGWMLVRGLVLLAERGAKLFDESFKFVDFTTYAPVEKFLDSWRPVVFALISLSILFLGLVLIFWQEKKPKLMMNICLAVLIITSSGYLIDQLNGFVTDDIRSAIINDGNSSEGTSGLIYDMVGSSVYDLIYLDDKLDGGLMKLTKKNRVTYDFTEEDLQLININEIVKPDDVKAESKDLVSNQIDYQKDGLQLKEIYNGVAWTDLLNEYYYRYDVEWWSVILGLISMILVYVCLAYKVVRILYEVVVQRLLAVLYSANLSSSQKTLKVLDSVKDSYITLILVMVCLKIYLLAFKMIGEKGFGDFSKIMMLLFIAFAVIDGPNIIQKLTGVDAGLSSGMGKIIAGVQATRMMSMMMNHGGQQIGNLFSGDRNNSDQVTGTGNQVDLEGTGKEEGMVPPEEEKESGQQGDSPAKPEEGTGTPTDMDTNDAEMPEGSGYTEDAGQAFSEDTGDMDGWSSSATEDLNGMDPLSEKPELENGLDRMERDLDVNKDKHLQSGLGAANPVEHQGTLFRSEWKENLEKSTKSSASKSELNER